MKIKVDGQEPSICYAAFNKTTETEFGERIHKKLSKHYLSNKDIEARTLHSLCYSWYIGTRNNEFIRDMKENFDTDAVIKFFQIEQYVAQRYDVAKVSIDAGDGKTKSKQNRIRFEAVWVAEQILKTLDNFLNSASVDVTDKHLPYNLTYRFLEWTAKLDVYLTKHRILKVTAAQHYSKYDFKGRAMALYQQSLALNEASGICMTHSVYQKFAQLSNAVLTSKRGKPFNVFLIDEAQDLNECQCAMITRQWQNGATIALVGDPAQSIYQFRGACRQFERWEVDCEETLTQSFRFGREIARMANIFLGLEKLWLVGLKSAMEAKGAPVKKEFGKPESGNTQQTPHTQHPHLTPGATPGPDGEPQQAGKLSMINALVRGLGPVQDKWVPPRTPVEYPYTVICRTNNSTYYALLSGIYESLHSTKSADTDDVEGQREGGGDAARAINNTGGATVANGVSGTVLGAGALGKRTFDSSFGGCTGRASAATASTFAAPSSAVVYDLTDIDEVTGPGAAPGLPPFPQAGVFMRHTLSKGVKAEIGSPTKAGGSTWGAIVAATAASKVTTTLVCADEVPRKRLFYINGVRSFAQLENGLVRRIEQLATISIQKPYMYKGEPYTNIDALKVASLEMEDVALLELVEITEKWGADIDNIKVLIAEHYAATAAEADVLVTTIHKSKGLEWGTVTLGDDIGSPLAAQPLFTIQCNPDPAVPAGSPHFIVSLEQTAKAAFERVNFMLKVGQEPSKTDEQNGARKVKPEPGTAVPPNPTAGWPCPRCSRINISVLPSCTGCRTARPAGPAAAAPGQGLTRVAALFHDDADIDVLEGEAEPTALEHYPAPPTAPAGPFQPSSRHTLVPLLPSTLALGQQLQRGLNVVGPNGAATPGPGAPASPRGSKCPLVCCLATHHNCADRVRQMYHHEIAERRRMNGAANVAAMESAGEGAANFRLVFANNAQAQAPTQAATQHPPSAPATAVKKEKGGEGETDAAAPRLDPFIIKFSNRQNANEWYVAVTRAKHTLRVNDDLAVIMEWVTRDIGGLRTQLRQVVGAEADPYDLREREQR
jgi:hypothetical protein